MKTIQFNKTNGEGSNELQEIIDTFHDWQGMGQVTFDKPKRTLKQNSSLHLYCEWIASRLTDKHIPFVESYFGKEFEQDWTMELVKEKVFKKALFAKFGKTSTTKATTGEICWVVDYLETNIAGKLGIDLAFPNRDRLEWFKHIN